MLIGVTLIDLSSVQSLGVLLWVGLGALTISLLILMRTRWGHARPISKCVALSVFAHFLLFGYAYATRLILEAPPREDIIEFTFSPPADKDIEPWPETERAPWDQLAVESQVEPGVSLTQPDLAITQPPTPFEREEPLAADILRKSALPVVADSVVINRPPVASPAMPEAVQENTPAPLGLTPERPGAPDTKIAEQVAEQAPRPDTPRPERIRRPTDVVDQQVQVKRSPEQHPESMLDVASQLQHLLDNPIETEQAEAVHDPLDRLRANQAGRTVPGRLASSETLAGSSGAVVAGSASSTSEPPPRRIGDGEELPQLYQSRIGAQRWRQVLKYGGSKETEQAVERALDWLADNQARHGGWIARDFGAGRGDQGDQQHRDQAGANADTGISGLALLAFLAQGNTHLEGPHRDTVRKGLEYLLSQQRRDGDLSGQARLYAKMYCHGMASLAVSEAWALTGDRALQPAVERAVAFTVAAQHPTTGGWRYQPGDQGDTSQFGWQLLALKSAELAGVPTPDSTRSGMVRFLRLVSTGPSKGLASYRPRGAASRTMTAEALLCRFMLGELGRTDAVNEAASFILEEPPSDGQMNLYYWYYGSLAMFQVQGESWHRWNLALQQQVLPKQIMVGEHRGSWDPDTAWGGYGGRVYSTAMAALCLEVYYRYLPVLN